MQRRMPDLPVLVQSVSESGDMGFLQWADSCDKSKLLLPRISGTNPRSPPVHHPTWTPPSGHPTIQSIPYLISHPPLHRNSALLDGTVLCCTVLWHRSWISDERADLQLQARIQFVSDLQAITMYTMAVLSGLIITRTAGGINRSFCML